MIDIRFSNSLVAITQIRKTNQLLALSCRCVNTLSRPVCGRSVSLQASLRRRIRDPDKRGY